VAINAEFTAINWAESDASKIKIKNCYNYSVLWTAIRISERKQ